MKAGDKVKFIGTPCGRTREAGIEVGQIMTLDKMMFRNPERWTCVGCDILFVEGDFELVKETE